MADILYDEVPSLDLADFTGNDGDKKKKFVAALGEAYNNIALWPSVIIIVRMD